MEERELTVQVTSLPFFFIDKVEGKPVWELPWELPRRKMTMILLADHMVQLAKRSFEGIGSLFNNAEGQVEVGPWNSRHINVFLTAGLTSYRTSAECKLAQIDHLLHLIRRKALGWDWRWHKTRKEDCNPVWGYALLLEAREYISESKEMNTEQPTYLRHGDDHEGQFLAAPSGELKAVIDWEMYAARQLLLTKALAQFRWSRRSRAPTGFTTTPIGAAASGTHAASCGHRAATT
jgi:hypothetical protein